MCCFGMSLHQIDISTIVFALGTDANDVSAIKTEDQLVKANISPRISMTILYYLAQANNAYVIGTGTLGNCHGLLHQMG